MSSLMISRVESKAVRIVEVVDSGASISMKGAYIK